MEQVKYSYHFSLHLCFENDVDVDKLEKHLHLVAYKKNFLKDSKGNKKTAKLWFKTQEYTDVNTDIVLENFVEKIYPNMVDLKEILQANKGTAGLTLYFTFVKDRPIIGLTTRTIEFLEKMGIHFEVDFKF